MKNQKYASLLAFVCRLIKKGHFQAFPSFVIAKVIQKFLLKLQRKDLQFNVQICHKAHKSPVSTDHRLFINPIVLLTYYGTDEECWTNVVTTYSRQGFPHRLLYQVVPCDEVAVNAVGATPKAYNELFHVNPSRPLTISLAKTVCPESPQIVKNATICVVSYHELSTSDADFIIGRYFDKPRFVHNQQVYEIELREELLGSWYYAEYFMTFSKLRKLVFMVTHLEDKNQKVTPTGIVMKSFTTLHQAANVNYKIPRKVYGTIDFPQGLKTYVGALVSSIEPFLNKNYVEDYSTQPFFLVEGPRGGGQSVIVDAMVERLGFSIHYVDCVELMSANVAAQTETRLATILAKSIQNSLIICFENFEVFGCEHGGQVDLRLVLALETMLSQFFERNKTSIIVAVSNQEVTQWKLRSLFLEIITIKPLSKSERMETLRWLLKKKGILGPEILNKFVPKAVEKTNGMSFGDLKVLTDNFAHFGSNADNLFEQFEREADELFKSCKENSLSIPKVQWSEIGGLADLKEEIQNSIKLPIKHKHLMGKYMKRSGILLHGPPGTGKTLIAKAVATEHQINFLSVQGPELLNMYVGQSEENVRQVFANAKANSPCVVFLDELDSLAPNRGQTSDSGGVMDRVVSQLLAELDAILADATSQVFILGATNRPDLIDPALLRPGRFDKLLFVGPFTKLEEKVAVLETVTSQFTLSKELTIEKLADKVKGNVTGAEVYAICSNAWLNAVRRTILKVKDAKAKAALTQKSVVVEPVDFEAALKVVGRA